VQTKTYTTEKEAKKAAARAYTPAIVRLPNGRYACFQAINSSYSLSTGQCPGI
jgi:hypothetical protein